MARAHAGGGISLLAFALLHTLALQHANAFLDRYSYGYADADAEMWGVGYAALWNAAREAGQSA